MSAAAGSTLNLQGALKLQGIDRGLVASGQQAAWRLENFFGRLVELSDGPVSAALTFTFRLVHQAQKLGEPVAWIKNPTSGFYPPDALACGIDLGALAVIKVGRSRLAPRAADLLMRSGAFGLVVIDLGRGGPVPLAVQTRLVGLARRHETALLCLTEKQSDQPSLGSLVSFRAEARRDQNRTDPSGIDRLRGDHSEAGQCGSGRIGCVEPESNRFEPDRIGPDRFGPDRFGTHQYSVQMRVLKDKRHGTGWQAREVRRGVDGLC